MATFKSVRKRDGSVVPFDQSRITDAVLKADSVITVVAFGPRRVDLRVCPYLSVPVTEIDA